MDIIGKIICFDINGTLTDDSSWRIFENSIEKSEFDSLLKDYSGGELSTEDLWKSMVNLLRKAGKANKSFIYGFWKNSLNLRPGAKELMDYLKNKGYEIYLISCSVDAYAKAIAEALGLKGFFTGSSFVFNSNDELVKIESRCKSDDHFKRDKVIELAENKGIDIKNIVFVGDGQNDIEAFKMTGHGIAMSSTNQELIKNSWKQASSLLEIMEIL